MICPHCGYDTSDAVFEMSGVCGNCMKAPTESGVIDQPAAPEPEPEFELKFDATKAQSLKKKGLFFLAAFMIVFAGTLILVGLGFIEAAYLIILAKLLLHFAVYMISAGSGRLNNSALRVFSNKIKCYQQGFSVIPIVTISVSRNRRHTFEGISKSAISFKNNEILVKNEKAKQVRTGLKKDYFSAPDWKDLQAYLGH